MEFRADNTQAATCFRPISMRDENVDRQIFRRRTVKKGDFRNYAIGCVLAQDGVQVV